VQREGQYTIPRFDNPRLKGEWIPRGYIFGNRNGRSIYNISTEGLFSFMFMVTLFHCLYTYDHKSKEISNCWKFLYIFPLMKNIALLPDFYFLKKAGQYSYLSLLVLVSNICVWSFSLYGFLHNKEIIFENLKAKSAKQMKPNKVKGIFRVVMIDMYLQFSLLIYFVFQVYKKTRILDFYREYFNPWNFCFSCTMNNFLLSIMTHKRSLAIWNMNFGLSILLGAWLSFAYLYYLYKLFTKKSEKLQLISKPVLNRRHLHGHLAALLDRAQFARRQSLRALHHEAREERADVLQFVFFDLLHFGLAALGRLLDPEDAEVGHLGELGLCRGEEADQHD
jgi:hypothetical protein